MSSPAIDPSFASGIVAGYAIGLVVLYVWVGLALSRVFVKSGVEGWKAWVPILNTVVLLQLGGFSGWLLLLALLVGPGTIALAIILIVACHRINLSFGHGAGMTVLAALLFPVWASVIGFGSSRWVGREAPPGPVRSRSADPADSPLGGALTGEPPTGGPAAAPIAGYTPFVGHELRRPAPGPASAGPPPVLPPPAPANWPAHAVPGQAGPGPVLPRPAVSAAAASALTPPPLPDATPASSAGSPVPPVPEAAPLVPPIAEVPAPVSSASAPSLADRPNPDVAGPARARRSAPADDLDDDDEPEAPGEPPVWTLPHEITDAVTGAVPGAPGPIAAVPARSQPSTEPVAARPPVTRVPADVASPARAEASAREPWAPALSPMPEADAFPETSAPVSAIAGAPAAGLPRSARASVSALHTRPHVPEDEGLDETVVTRRKRMPWTLVPASGRSVGILSPVLILGRRPVSDPDHPDAQLIAVDDETRTVSKTHARLELRDDRWWIVDLHSTNGVVLTDAAGAEIEAEPGVESAVGERFLLGDAEIRLERSGA